MCRLGAWDGASRLPQYFQFCKKVGEKAVMLQESWQQYQQYFLWPFFSNNSWSIDQSASPQQKMSRHITPYKHVDTLIDSIP